MNNTVLSVVLAVGLSLLGFWILLGLLLLVLMRTIKERVKRVESYAKQPVFDIGDLNLVKPRGENLTKDETKQVRKLLRKEEEAHELNSIDIARESDREI